MVRDIAISCCQNEVYAFKDLDLMAEGISAGLLESVLEILQAENALIKHIDYVGKSFGVWKLSIEGFPQPVDLALARTEQSFSTHHRDFEITTEGVSAKDDAGRRDFTMNAMNLELLLDGAEALNARLQDFYGGIDAIRQRRIQCVGDPLERFKEDPLRMLRAIRFHAKLSGFEIEAQTAAKISELVPALLRTVSLERIAEELYKALLADAATAVADLRQFGVFQELFPGMDSWSEAIYERTVQRIAMLKKYSRNSVQPALVFAALLYDVALHENERKLVQHLSASLVSHRFFSTATIKHAAQHLRLPNERMISSLCCDAVRLQYYQLLKAKDAVIEEILLRSQNTDALVSLYKASQVAAGLPVVDFQEMIKTLKRGELDFNRILVRSGIPAGSHLQEIKLCLRQAEIDGMLQHEGGAKALLDKLYTEEKYVIDEHVHKVKRLTEKPMPGRPASEQLKEEIRWLLFSRPVRLIQAYHEAGVLGQVFPELAEAEETVEATQHHFIDSFLNTTTRKLSLLYEEMPDPDPVHILALLFMDIGKSRTKTTKSDGKVAYHNHASVGAEMADQICRRLGIDMAMASEVYFIINNHNALITKGGANRIKRLLKKVPVDLVNNLLIVHKIDQMAKMRIKDGVIIDDGQLNNYHASMALVEQWPSARGEQHALKPLVSGKDLVADNQLWGIGLATGVDVGRLKQHLQDLQARGVLNTKQEALEVARGSIVLSHLLNDPAGYLEALSSKGLLDEILPEIGACVGLEQTSAYHMEDVYTHTLYVIRELPETVSPECRLAAVFHDVGKPLTRTFDNEKKSYHFYAHEKQSLEKFDSVCERFGWDEGAFDHMKVKWLIENHMKLKIDLTGSRNPQKTIEKMFFRGKGAIAITDDYREDLKALMLADTRGRIPIDVHFQEEQLAQSYALINLMDEVGCEVKIQQTQERLHERIKAIWNGHLAMQYFDSRGPDLQELLSRGQHYVRDRFTQGETAVTVEQVVDFLRKNN